VTSRREICGTEPSTRWHFLCHTLTVLSAVWSESRPREGALHGPRWKRVLVDLGAIVARMKPAERPQSTPTRVLRWVFSKNHATLQCELSCGDEWFTLRTNPPYPANSVGVERFSQVTEAFERQCELEALLVKDGWSLDSHASLLV
jgi:hypothetical protein